MHQGSITAAIFNDFVGNQVLPQCLANGDPRSVLLFDNARCHWNDELIQMCDEANVTIARLLPYSPDFNLIETLFLLLKAWICRNGELSISYTDKYGGFDQFLNDALKEQCRLGNPGNLLCLAGIQYPTIDLINTL